MRWLLVLSVAVLSSKRSASTKYLSPLGNRMHNATLQKPPPMLYGATLPCQVPKPACHPYSQFAEN
jgi:hypothetical protein